MTKSKFEPYDYEVAEVAEIKAFFRKIARTLNQFAEEHNLKIEKYYNRGPSWDFLFRHPEGGSCYVEVRMDDKEHAKLFGNWSIHDIDTRIDRNKHTQFSPCSTGRIELRNKLEEMLALVLSWNCEDLEIVGKRSRDFQKQCTKEELEADLKRYPIPKLD